MGRLGQLAPLYSPLNRFEQLTRREKKLKWKKKSSLSKKKIAKSEKGGEKDRAPTYAETSPPIPANTYVGEKRVTPSSPEAHRTAHRRLRRPKSWSGCKMPQSRMFQKSVRLSLPPWPHHLLLPPLPAPPPPPPHGNRPCHLAYHPLIA